MLIQKIIKGNSISIEESSLSKIEWNKLMVIFDFKEKLILFY